MTNPNGHGGARKGSGRKPKLTMLQRIWMKRRRDALMFERAKERALRQQFPAYDNDDCDDELGEGLDELRAWQADLRKLPLSKRKGIEARELQENAASLIKRRVVHVGAGTGPLVQSGPCEPTAFDICSQLASEANQAWGRTDITPRMVRRASEQNYTDEQIVADYLERLSEKLEKGVK